MAFTPKNWIDGTTHETQGPSTTAISAVALEDMETRLSDYTDLRVGEGGDGRYNVVDYGADPTGVAASTTAFNSAIAAAQADSTPGVVVVPSGTYLCGNLDVITDRALKIVGISGPKSPDNIATSRGFPQITHTGAGVLFDIGTFDTTPTNYWSGESQGFHIEGLRLYNNAGQAQGSRTRTAIRDNGCGNAIIQNVEISQFQYGFAAPYGSDFSVIRDCCFLNNDVGIYLGPGTEQIDIATSAFYFCMEGFVADSSPQGLMTSCWFMDSRTVDIQFEKLNTTRFGLTSAGNAYNDLKWVIRSCWHESNANADNVKATNGHIRTYTDNALTTYPRGLRVVDPYLVAAGSGGANRSFWECHDGEGLILENLLVYGDQVVYAMNCDTGATWLTQKGLRSVDGYTAVIPFRNEDATCIYLVEGQPKFGLVDVASATTVTMPAYVDRVLISGAVNIETITASYPGRVITLLFGSNPVIDWAGGGGARNIYLDGGADFSATANDTLTLMAGFGNWYEIGRSVN